MADASTDQIRAATRIVRSLTGARWTWPRKRVVEEYYVPDTVSTITLSGRPVSGVNSVVGRDGTPYEFELSDGFILWIPALDGCAGAFSPYTSYDATGGFYPPGRWRGTPLRVDYTYGARPPIDIRRAINQLASEFVQADCNGTCKLPERVTSINREGVSWTIIDPQEFLKDGRVGLYYVDLAISTYGNRPRARARVFSPEHRPPRRLSSTLIVGDTP